MPTKLSKQNNRLDMLLVNVPMTFSDLPPMAPALLKSCLIREGYTAGTLDFNIRMVNQSADLQHLIDYFLLSHADSETIKEAEQLAEKWADEIIEINPRWVGISLFTFQCRSATNILCRLLKQKRPDIKIVIGGSGLSSGGINGINEYPRELQSKGHIDHFIMSEAEESLIRLLKEDLDYPGIDSDTYNNVKDIESIPYPDWDDYDFSEYTPVMMIYGSRGCVRKCSFCDIHQHWKYTARPGESVAKEMIHQSEKYGVTDFRFADSLTNGSLKEFRKFIRIMAEYNDSAEKKITWTGYYIVRDPMAEKEEHWDLMKRSGAERLLVGIESGSEKIREDMDKKFKNSDIDYLLEQAHKQGIKLTFLMIVGYPTETREDFEETIAMFHRYKKYAGNTIENVSVSDTLGILPGTPLVRDLENLNIILDPKFEINWLCLDNPELDLRTRVMRVIELRDLISDLGYSHVSDHKMITMQMLNENEKRFNERLKIIAKTKAPKKTFNIVQI